MVYTRQQFINKVAPDIVKHATHIRPSVAIAQSCLESANGNSELAIKANNLFGIKASEPWSGSAYNKVSGEHKNGKKVYEASDFRKYTSWSESIKDHAGFFTSTEFRASDAAYGLAIKAKDYQTQARMLGPKFSGDKSSYATDPNYGNKLIEIIESYNLTSYDKEFINKNNKGEDVKVGYIGIDIGHGSNTWSTGGGKGLYAYGKTHEEHTFNSIVARKLKALLESSGHKVTYGVQQPMSNDTSLLSRTNRFNSAGVDIMVSIHANWIGTAFNSTNGIGAFYANYSNTSATRRNNSKRLADLIMAQYRKQGQTIYGAGSIPSVLTNWTNFHMTRQTNMPAVLMELGFMSGNKDFDKIFGSQQDRYTTQMAQGLAAGINAYFGVKGSVSNNDSHNPQGLKETTPTAYKEPSQPFTTLMKGSTVTILSDKNKDGNLLWQWYNPTSNKLMLSTKQKELAGTKDTIEEVKSIKPVQHSKYAYLLKGSKSWILEEYLVEPRSKWSSTSKPTTPTTPKPTEPVNVNNKRTTGNWRSNQRTAPYTTAKVTQVIEPNFTFTARGYVYGESVNGNNVWLVGDNSGEYIHTSAVKEGKSIAGLSWLQNDPNNTKKPTTSTPVKKEQDSENEFTADVDIIIYDSPDDNKHKRVGKAVKGTSVTFDKIYLTSRVYVSYKNGRGETWYLPIADYNSETDEITNLKGTLKNKIK